MGRKKKSKAHPPGGQRWGKLRQGACPRWFLGPISSLLQGFETPCLLHGFTCKKKKKQKPKLLPTPPSPRRDPDLSSPRQTSTENKQPQTSAVRAGFQRGFLHHTPLDSPCSSRHDGKQVSPGCLLRKVGKPTVCFQPQILARMRVELSCTLRASVSPYAERDLRSRPPLGML